MKKNLSIPNIIGLILAFSTNTFATPPQSTSSAAATSSDSAPSSSRSVAHEEALHDEYVRQYGNGPLNLANALNLIESRNRRSQAQGSTIRHQPAMAHPARSSSSNDSDDEDSKREESLMPDGLPNLPSPRQRPRDLGSRYFNRLNQQTQGSSSSSSSSAPVSAAAAVQCHEQEMATDAGKILTGMDIADIKCAICLGNIETDHIVTKLSCGCKSGYHESCIDDWIKRKNSCPMCHQPALWQDKCRL